MESIKNKILEELLSEEDGGGGDAGGVMTSTGDISGPDTPLGKPHRRKKNEELEETGGTDFSLAFTHGLKDYGKRVTKEVKKNIKRHVCDMGGK